MYTDGYGFSDVECKIIMAQIERRAKLRKEFLRLRSDPCQHASQAGYVFDPALQRFMSMKVSQLDFFRPNARTIRFGVFAVILPMLSYGLLIWNQRSQIERDIRCGKIKYRDRLF
ncbi:NADH dehydrogenase, partial [Operophtera brumata]